ncbi:F-box domain - like 10 [Theobroma cacao]|nr:F-box domain - like 10 [Theobroma cacao]
MASHGRRKRQKEFHVPEELIMSIFVNLPVKSLLRFNCVSKLWRSLIIDQDFIEQHLSNQKKKDPQLLFATIISQSQVDLKSMYINVDRADEGTGEVVTTGLTITLTNLPGYDLSMSHSCDGVLCFYGPETIIVCNPSTREIRHFSYGFGWKGVPSGRSTTIGLGRDQVTKQFKIVRLFNRAPGNFDECEAFTLGPDPNVSCRRLGEAPYFVISLQSPIYVNGALHWITCVMRHISEASVSFDLHAEKFRAIPHPSCLNSHSDRCYMEALMPLRNSLCLAELTANKKMNIWIFMKDCNSSPALNKNMGAWEMLHSIDLKFSVSEWRLGIPIAEHKNGMLSTIYYGGRLQLYTPKSKMFRDVLVHCGALMPTEHFESLVPLYAEKHMG